MVAVEMMAHGASGVLWCDGRRMNDLLPGSRIEVRKSEKPVLLARIHPAPFSERLVRKFALPIRGWRGPTSEEEREVCDAGEKQFARSSLVYIWYSHGNRMFGHSSRKSVSAIEPHIACVCGTTPAPMR